MSDTQRSWMIDGRPGLVVGAMAAAMASMGDVVKGAGDKGAAAQDVMDVVRPALIAHGIVPMVMTTPAEFQHAGKALFASLEVTVRFLASDGSYLESHVAAGGTAQNLKSVQAAITSGIKSLYRHQFVLSFEETEKPKQRRAGISKELRAHIQYLQTLTTAEEMESARAHETGQALKPRDWPGAEEAWRQRFDTIVAVQGARMRSRAAADRMTAQAAHEAAAAEAKAKSTRRTGPRGKPVDLRDVEPLDTAPSKRGNR